MFINTCNDIIKLVKKTTSFNLIPKTLFGKAHLFMDKNNQQENEYRKIIHFQCLEVRNRKQLRMMKSPSYLECLLSMIRCKAYNFNKQSMIG